MADLFYKDPHSGVPKILFIGLSQSTHTHAWIDLLSNAKFNVRLFSLPGGTPPVDWPVKTYLSGFLAGRNSEKRKYMYSGLVGKLILLFDKLLSKLKKSPIKNKERWLAEIIKEWRPDIIHTLGLFDDQGGEMYLKTRQKFNLQGIGKWILQTRGGSDMTLRRHNTAFVPILKQALGECDRIISDNKANIRYAEELGISLEKFAPIVPVPGTGGIDIPELSKDTIPPSHRERIILWPKAYESQWSKALPVLEAIQLAWDKIFPCEIYMLATTPEVREWYLTLPEKIRAHCHVQERIARKDVFPLMKRSRILLIPSLVDGVPNSLYEAMACGAFPIVSPLETIQSVVTDPQNVLFARNLYPNEIADALIKAMNDDTLVDDVACNNLVLVHEIANRETISSRVVDYYHSIAG